MTESLDISAPRYYGVFRKLADLGIAESSGNGVDLYGPHFASFYNTFIGGENYDIEFYARLMPGPGARVLDLACGSGRIGIALARLGADVDGIDLSIDMLGLVPQKLAIEAPTVAERFHARQGDITRFNSPHPYDLAVLGATSLSLLLSCEQRIATFRCVRTHLKPAGQFAFDILELSGERWKELDGFVDIWTQESETGQEFALVGQKFDPSDGTFTFNVYREVITWDGTTERYLGASTKARLAEENLTEELRAAGLKVTRTERRNGVIMFVVAQEECP